MEAFLEKIAVHLLKTYPDKLDKLAIVFPNRRAGLFLRKFLSKNSSKPLWAPAIYSIEDFVFHLSGLQAAETDLQILELYKAYQEVEKDNAQDFSDFLNWAPVALQDYNEADLYLADSRELFSYLSEARALQVWNLDQKPLTAFELGYLHFYHSLYDYYRIFEDSLMAKGKVTQGMAYRFAAENIEKLTGNLDCDHVVFAGFSALTAAEESIIKYFLGHGSAEIFWDADHYYLDNDIREAGKFLRYYHENWKSGPFNWIEDHYRLINKKINIIGIPQNAGQVKVAGELLERLDPSEGPSTVVVLGDENLLVPMLISMPEKITEFNVTMGLPLKFTPPYDLFDHFFNMHENAARLSFSATAGVAGKGSAGKPYRFYHADLIRLFDHPYFRLMLEKQAEKQGLQNFMPALKIKKLQKVFYVARDIQTLLFEEMPGFFESLSPLFGEMISKPEGIIRTIQYLINLIKDCFARTRPDGPEEGILLPSLELEYLYAFASLLQTLSGSLKEYGFTMDLKTLHKLFRTSAESTKLPFYGEPLMGVQVMGMLETRNLDFKNIIILNMNEDILPAGKHHPSFIPFDVRKDFGLSTYQDRHAVFAYHFYRLLQRAENVYLLYNTEPGKLSGGDKSRFIMQIEHELPIYNPDVQITESAVNFKPPAGEKAFVISVPKDKQSMEIIRRKAEKGFSASALNKFRVCGLKYYLGEIEGIEEPEEVNETMDAATLGTALHEVLYDLYGPYLSKPLDTKIIDSLLELAETKVNEIFSSTLPGADLATGKNHLLMEVVRTLVKRFLRDEKAFAAKMEREKKAWVIEGLEQELNVSGFDTGLTKVNLFGRIDRIDSIAGRYRVIDYKTGSVSEPSLKLKDWDSLDDDPKKDKLFQLLFYTLLFSSGNDYQASAAEAGIISFRNLTSGFMVLKAPPDQAPGASFSQYLSGLINSLMDENATFDQTRNTDSCRYCSFAPVCNR